MQRRARGRNARRWTGGPGLALATGGLGLALATGGLGLVLAAGGLGCRPDGVAPLGAGGGSTTSAAGPAGSSDAAARPPGAAVAGLSGLAGATAAGDRRSAHTTGAAMTPALRHAFVVARMAEAGAAHAVRMRSGVPTVAHPSMPLRARFFTAGVRLDAGEHSAWHGTLRLRAVGRGDALAELPDAAPVVRTNRVTYQRGTVRAWYASGPLGIEQGATLGERPPGEGELRIAVALHGWHAEPAGDAVTLVDAQGTPRARVTDLWAADARGTVLPSRFAVRDGQLAYVVDDRHARYPIHIDPLVAVQQAILKASNAAAADRFGVSVSISGDTAVVGAYNKSYSGLTRAGQAYVYVRSGSTWSQQAILKASNAASSDYFGLSVSISGDTAVVGADHKSYAGLTQAGQAYVYVRSASTWSQQAILKASDAAAGDYFGVSVSISGDTAVVGASSKGYSGLLYAGEAYAFVRSSSTWSQQAILKASNAAAYDRFGASVSISGDTAVVGANSKSYSGMSEAGEAYAFVRSGSTWSQQAILKASDAARYADFGLSVSVSGDTAVVGAPHKTYAALTEAGEAYAYVRSGSTWSQRAILKASDAASYADFGQSVSISGDTAVVGAFTKSSSGMSQAGQAYVFVVALAKGDACTKATQCASGYCVDGVCCDKACAGGTSDCQACSKKAGAAADGTCGPVSSGTTCRASAGSCDVAETCNGTATTCPTDSYAASTKQCRASAGACDVAETCTGTSAQCPTDSYAASTKQCRASAGACDVAETCSGTSARCPADAFASGKSCRAASCSSGVETLAASCDGTAATCPAVVTKVCGSYACGTTACLSSCSRDGDCASGYVCSSSACVAPPDAGPPDASLPDAGPPDASLPDAGPPDAPTPTADGSLPDADTPDAQAPTADAALAEAGAPDAGASDAVGSDSTVGADALAADSSARADASGTTGGSDSGAEGQASDGGCNCRAAGSSDPPPGSSLLLLGLVALRRRRRRRGGSCAARG